MELKTLLREKNSFHGSSKGNPITTIHVSTALMAVSVNEFFLSTEGERFKAEIGGEQFTCTLLQQGSNRNFPVRIGTVGGFPAVEISISVYYMDMKYLEDAKENGVTLIY